MEMHQVRYFLAVAKNLNFTRGAEECNVSQPSLTRAIKQLEERVRRRPVPARAPARAAHRAWRAHAAAVEAMLRQRGQRARARAVDEEGRGRVAAARAVAHLRHQPPDAAPERSAAPVRAARMPAAARHRSGGRRAAQERRRRARHRVRPRRRLGPPRSLAAVHRGFRAAGQRAASAGALTVDRACGTARGAPAAAELLRACGSHRHAVANSRPRRRPLVPDRVRERPDVDAGVGPRRGDRAAQHVEPRLAGARHGQRAGARPAGPSLWRRRAAAHRRWRRW